MRPLTVPIDQLQASDPTGPRHHDYGVSGMRAPSRPPPLTASSPAQRVARWPVAVAQTGSATHPPGASTWIVQTCAGASACSLRWARRLARFAGGAAADAAARRPTGSAQADRRARPRRVRRLVELEPGRRQAAAPRLSRHRPANPLRGLTNDSQYLASVLATVDGPIVLVGHSYGGAVITNAATGNANVKALVYIAAFALDQGESLASISAQFPDSDLGASILPRPYPGGADLYIRPDLFRAVFAADLPRSATDAWPSRSGHSPISASVSRPAHRRGRRSRPGTWSPPTTAPSTRPPSGSWPSELTPTRRSSAPHTWSCSPIPTTSCG